MDSGVSAVAKRDKIVALCLRLPSWCRLQHHNIVRGLVAVRRRFKIKLTGALDQSPNWHRNEAAPIVVLLGVLSLIFSPCLWGAFALGCENTGFNTAFVNFSPTDRSFGFYRADIRFVAEYLFLGPSKVNIC